MSFADRELSPMRQPSKYEFAVPMSVSRDSQQSQRDKKGKEKGKDKAKGEEIVN